MSTRNVSVNLTAPLVQQPEKDAKQSDTQIPANITGVPLPLARCRIAVEGM